MVPIALAFGLIVCIFKFGLFVIMGVAALAGILAIIVICAWIVQAIYTKITGKELMDKEEVKDEEDK